MCVTWHGVGATYPALQAFGWCASEQAIVLALDPYNVRAEDIQGRDYALLRHVNKAASHRLPETVEAVLSQSTRVRTPQNAPSLPVDVNNDAFRFPCDGCGQTTLHAPMETRAQCLCCGRSEILVQHIDCPSCDDERLFAAVGTRTLACLTCREKIWDAK